MLIEFPEKFCEECGAQLTLKITRDIIRKRFCDHVCMGRWNGKRSSKPHTDSTKAKMSIARRQFYVNNPETKKRMADNLRSMRRPIGSKNSAAHNKAVSDGAKRHAALELDDCRCFIHSPVAISVSALSWKLIDFLVNAGFEIVIPEAQFGRYHIDALLANEWIGIEADGAYWHNAEYDKIRDQKLLEKFSLPIVRLTEEDIKCLR